ncbi:hypothetical protein HFN69_14500 [Rhizobium laguerreae]|uniref:hypothetical protein n=1 Tax=Rhizobium TaxID=379 RepID=UPI001C9232EE|nr:MULTISPECIES: hypothetical protein [Rhizobium]MBY3310952.1 hypothetical protein [Rhizobium laguerreae]MBY3324076.1 hypothetical protein [Rhizobium laguerreae]MBY3540070.1 hypothetical protein [Rhizobium laguerreae]MBY3547793.1 hypothetical protein [Rhizobium laguerreae]MBY5779431.1 hypothetical protein [Rhizobium leguminosarum]
MTDGHSSIANRDQSATQPVLVLRPSTRALISVVCVMAIFFVYLSLIAVGQIEMSRPTSGVGEGLFAILFLVIIVFVVVKARQVDYTKPIMVIGPDGITGQKLPKLIPWSMIERVETPQAGRAGLIYLTVRKDADPEILKHLHKWQPFQNRTFGIPNRVPGYSSSEVKDIVNRYFESSQRG